MSDLISTELQGWHTTNIYTGKARVLSLVSDDDMLLTHTHKFCYQHSIQIHLQEMQLQAETALQNADASILETSTCAENAPLLCIYNSFFVKVS